MENPRERIREIEKRLAQLPKGTLTYKTINGKKQPYVQRTVDGRSVSYYVKVSERAQILMEFAERKRLVEERKHLLAYREGLAAILKKNPYLDMKVGCGYQDFRDFACGRQFYVDKTHFIAEWLRSESKVTLITRPRRFGKTTLLSTVENFLDPRFGGHSEYFEKLQVWTEEDCRTLYGTIPVISVSFGSCKGRDYAQAIRGMISSFYNLYESHRYLMEGEKLDAEDKAVYQRMKKALEMGDETKAESAIPRLCRLLYRYYGIWPVILLDEYDTPLQEAYFNSFWDEMVSFVGAFFNNSFKTNPSLGRALLTGITRICKESIFSDLNNIDVVAQTSTKYETAFGFTEEEVKVGLARVGLLDYREKVKEWYDGFTFGQRRDMYNPWSITKFIDAEGIFDTYWANTSNNKLVSSLIRKSSKNMKMAMEQLLEGEMLHVEMDEQLDFAQLEYRESAIFSLLYATGYLRVNQKNDQEYVLMLTNKEVEIMFRRIIREWFNDMDTGYGDFRRALLHDNIEEMNYYMNMVTLSTFSYFDTGTGRGNIDETERFYHGFVLGLLADLSDQFSIRSNRESGLGRYDIILRAREENGNSYIMEFKVFDRERDENMKACVARALQQIEEKQYETELVADGIARERIRKYGFAFDGKKVLIGS